MKTSYPAQRHGAQFSTRRPAVSRLGPRGLLLGLWLLILVQPLSTLEARRPLDAIVAIVNDDVITDSELGGATLTIARQLRERGTPLPPPEILARQVLERLILDRLQVQRAKSLGIQVDDGSLNRAIQLIAEQNNLSLFDLKNLLEADGVDFGQFREETRQQILLNEVRKQEVGNRIQITQQEIKDYLATEATQLNPRHQVRLFHILLATPSAASPQQILQTEQESQQLVAQLRSGTLDFQATAVAKSDGRNALEGGDLGWKTLGEVPSVVADFAAREPRGAISDPMRSASGYHIFMLADYAGEQRRLVEQAHARHILVKVNEVVSEEDARRRLATLRDRLLAGEAFDTLAKSHSDDTASAIKGGDLGWVNPGDTAPRFDARLQQLPVGQISEPFRSQFGWHLLQVLERRTHDSTEQHLQTQAQALIRQRKTEEATQLWLQRLRDEAYVELRLDRAYD